MNSNMVKPEKFDHLHLAYHFTVPLNLYITLNLVALLKVLKNLKKKIYGNPFTKSHFCLDFQKTQMQLFTPKTLTIFV